MGAYGPLCASITRRMLRMQPRQPALAYTQLAAATVGWVFLFLPILIMSATAYRPGRAAETTEGILDRSRVPVFPRWVAYLSLWVTVLFVPTGVITFFKTGPFTYGGLLGFSVPLAVFVIWLVRTNLHRPGWRARADARHALGHHRAAGVHHPAYLGDGALSGTRALFSEAAAGFGRSPSFVVGFPGLCPG